MPGDQREFTYTNADVHPRIGDRARFVDRPGEVLVVEDVIDCEAEQELWGWEGDEFGIMLNGGEGYGLVGTQHVSTEVELISRDEQMA